LSTILLISCARSTDTSIAPAQSDELIIVGRLNNISAPLHCGYVHFGAVAEYTDLRITSGQYLKDKVYVVHGCPELSRNEYAEGSGNLASFEIGAYHVLHLTLQNEIQIGVIDPGKVLLPIDTKHSQVCSNGCDAETFVQVQNGTMYFSSQVDEYAP
jgi:hypothetical protein